MLKTLCKAKGTWSQVIILCGLVTISDHSHCSSHLIQLLTLPHCHLRVLDFNSSYYYAKAKRSVYALPLICGHASAIVGRACSSYSDHWHPLICFKLVHNAKHTIWQSTVAVDIHFIMSNHPRNVTLDWPWQKSVLSGSSFGLQSSFKLHL